MSKLATPAKLVGVLAGLLVLAAIVLYLIPSNDYLLLPDGAHPVAPLVTVQGGHDPKGPGGIYFVDVFERHASEFESLFPWIHRGATLVPAREIVPPGVSDKAARQADLRAMSISQKVAAAVALRRLGYKVVAKPSGVVVAALDASSHAVGKLQPSDLIVAVNGAPTPAISQLRAQLAKVKPGDPVTLTIDRGADKITVHVQTMADPRNHKHAIVGFAPEQAAQIELPLKVRIDAGNVGGPSAGLAFALEVMEKLGHKIDRGYRVAATGEINLDGTVSPIGGIEQKTFGAREAKADVFLVPVENAADARRYAHGLRIIPVKSFPQALRALATLPPKGSNGAP
jgi:PDZ domain-containing protein